MKEKQPGNLKFYPFIHAARTRIIVCLPSNQVSGVLRHHHPGFPFNLLRPRRLVRHVYTEIDNLNIYF